VNHRIAFVGEGSEDEDDDDETSRREATDTETSCTKHRTRLERRRQQLQLQQQQQQQERDQVTKKRRQRRRRIVEVVDSSMEEDEDDVTNNNHLPPTPAANVKQSTRASSNDGARKQPFLSSTANRENPPDSVEFTSGPRQPNLIESRLPNSGKRSEATQPADYIGSGRTGLIGSVRPSLVNRSVQSIRCKADYHGGSAECCSKGADCDSMKTSRNVRLPSNNAVKLTNTALTNDIATFSLAFDDFLSGEEDEDFTNQVTEYTRLKFPKDRTHSAEKPDGNFPDVVISSQVAGTLRQIVSEAGCRTMSGEPGLIGSGQPSSVQSRSTDITSRSYCLSGSGHSSCVSQSGCVTGSGQGGLIGSRRPSLEAERLREERLRLSRLKKAEFQRKHRATLTSNQPRVMGD